MQGFFVFLKMVSMYFFKCYFLDSFTASCVQNSGDDTDVGPVLPVRVLRERFLCKNIIGHARPVSQRCVVVDFFLVRQFWERIPGTQMSVRENVREGFKPEMVIFSLVTV